jgi:hypothetical protein
VRAGSTGENESTQFTRLMDGVSDAVTEFQNNMTPENFTRVITAFGEMGQSGAKFVRGTTDYIRRHPVRVALGASLFYFALKGLLQSEPRRISSRDSTFH